MIIFIVLFLYLVDGDYQKSSDNIEKNGHKEMAETSKEIIIRNKMGKIVARINVKDTVLHGHCEWYDGKGNLIAYGFFKNGAPFTGTFLNWANFLTQLHKENPYDAEVYCQDWVSIFEASFRSEFPKYEMVIEAYYNGTRISLWP